MSLQGEGGQVSGSGNVLPGEVDQLILSYPVVQGRAPGSSLLWHSPLGV